MSILLEFALLSGLALLTVAAARAATRRRSTRRAAMDAGAARFPCRVTWREGLGRRGSVYGKISAPRDEEPTFTRRWGPGIHLPRSLHIDRQPSWRMGLTTLTYTAPEHGEIRILLSEGDAESVKKLLRAEA
jgi:hypothetical protein